MMAMIKEYTKIDSCPKNVVPYNGHQFIGKSQEQILGRDYRNFVFDVNTESLELHFSDDTGSYTSTIGAGDLDNLGIKIINEFTGRGANSTTLGYVVSGGFLYLYVTGTVQANLQITIRNGNTGVRGDGSLDPESDGRDGIKPYNFFINGNSKCEIIELGNKAFDCTTDKLLFISEGTQQTVDGVVFGRSEPEGTQWSNIPARDNRSRSVFMTIETDGLGAINFGPIVNTYASFSSLIDEINGMLTTYGSSFRVIGNAAGNRILVTQLNGTIIVGGGDPYVVANGFNQMYLIIEDSVTNNDWLVKGTNPKDFTVSNIIVGSGASGMFVGEMPCPTSSLVVPTPQISILSGHGSNGASTIQFVAKYNEADRWILDYEPEIYLYFKKKRRGSNASGKHNIRYRHKLAHTPKSDGTFATQSLKKDVNPRLNAVPENRVVDTEWLVDGTQTEMTTIFTLRPFQFLGSVVGGDAGTGTFPMLKSDWNKAGTGTMFPATFTTKNRSSQDNARGRPLTHMTAYFKTVIRNPNGGHPIESEESYPIIIYPDVHVNQTGKPDEYTHWGVNINYNTR